MYNPPFTITPKILNLVGEITEVITKLKVFDKKRKRQGKDKEKKVNKKTNHSSSLPHLFLISSPSSPSFIIGNKKEFSNRLKKS